MKKLYILFLIIPVLVFGQSQNQNYIKNITYKKASTEEQIDVNNPAHAAVTVQYFDGLGRPIQQVAHKQSNTGKDIIVHIGYDEFGRQTKEYLPYVRSSASLDFDPSGEANTIYFYHDDDFSLTGNPHFETTDNPYSEKELEASPLSRVFEQAAPGNPWEKSLGRTIKFDYQTNDYNEVVYFKANTQWTPTLGVYAIEFEQAGYYDPNLLYKTITKDENWTSGLNNTTEEFKNKQGQVVLKRTYNNDNPHDTYYVYDIYGNLTYVIPPLVNTSYPIDLEVLDGLCYQYKYDTRNRLVEKKLPGKQWEFIVYNKLDKPVLTGPAYSPFGSTQLIGWLITKYDAFGRVAYTGWMSMENINSQTRFDFQDDVNTSSQPLFESKTTSASSIDGVQVKYTNQAFPTDPFELLTVNYYDNYDYPNAPIPPSEIYDEDVLINVKTLPTGTWTRFLTNENETIGELSYSFYDEKGRPIASATINHLGGTTTTQSKLDFEGKVLYTDTGHQRTANDDVLNINDVFSYSDQSKLVTHLQQVESNPQELIVYNEYDELGQLIAKQVGGQDVHNLKGYQRIDYQYNIRGWLKSINDIKDLRTDNGYFQDLFSYTINYNTVTKKNIDTNVIGEVNNSYDGKVKELYNGNISETYWRTSTDNVLRKYSYSYDNLNRLNDSFYQKPESTIEPTNAYNESMDYDKNGNINRISRTGNYDGNDQTFLIDELEYIYLKKSNLLLKVTDSTNESLGFKDDIDDIGDSQDDYSYDAFGNMIADQNKKIVKISYNHLNLPTSITFADSNKITYFYNASGVKLKKVVSVGTSEKTTDYLGGFQYDNTILQFFPHPEGYVKNTRDNQGNPTFDYVYNYTDHLGNIRLSYTLEPQNNVLTILEENHYYPFGLKHTNYNTDRKSIDLELISNLKRIVPVLKVNYDYKYNGKEWQDELGLNFYDYGARNYDPAIGRWMNIDPLAELADDLTPYHYANNNPIIYIDPDGLSATSPESWATKYVDKTGKTILDTDDGSDDVIVVPDAMLGDFEYYKESYEKGGNNSLYNSTEWNDNMKATILGFESTDEMKSLLDGFSTQWSRQNAIDYLQNPTFRNAMAMSYSEALSQWTDPQKVLAAASVLAFRPRTDVNGIIYLRTDLTGKVKPYVGQAKNEARYLARQKEHARANPDADFDFKIIDRGSANGKFPTSLDIKEQKALDKLGGPTNKGNPSGGASNKKNVVKQ
jgi:RHS repeat-associated protein